MATVAATLTPGGSLLVARCPFCGRRHVHGGAAAGERLSHCLTGARPYLLTLEQAIGGAR